ncbi:hypothetical protein E2C01_044747 [Portunus trituberculatus]|uniref:Uncharacterized protein n=1 Tax=Portunus trituberculatus TaxID=210409 RepID=A0A5B7G348_PORTR|nr:hypothetical protein [Portunus trituberculatus]
MRRRLVRPKMTGRSVLGHVDLAARFIRPLRGRRSVVSRRQAAACPESGALRDLSLVIVLNCVRRPRSPPSPAYKNRVFS